MCVLYHLYLKRYSNEDRRKYVFTKVCAHTGRAPWTTLKSYSLKALLVSRRITVLQKFLSERRNFLLSTGSIQLTCVEGNYRANTITTTFLSFWMFSSAYAEPGNRWMRLGVWTLRYECVNCNDSNTMSFFGFFSGVALETRSSFDFFFFISNECCRKSMRKARLYCGSQRSVASCGNGVAML